MPDLITQGPDGALHVTDATDHPVHRGRRHRRGHLAGGQVGARRRRGQVRPDGGVEGGAGRPEGVRRDRPLAARRDHRDLPHPPHRHQGAPDHAGRRGHPVAQRGPPPDPRPLRLPAPGALVHRRALTGAPPRAGRHGHLPGEHRGHLRRTRGRGLHPGGGQAVGVPPRRDGLGDPRGLGHRDQAHLRVRVQAAHPGRHQVRPGPRPRPA